MEDPISHRMTVVFYTLFWELQSVHLIQTFKPCLLQHIYRVPDHWTISNQQSCFRTFWCQFCQATARARSHNNGLKLHVWQQKEMVNNNEQKGRVDMGQRTSLECLSLLYFVSLYQCLKRNKSKIRYSYAYVWFCHLKRRPLHQSSEPL